MAQYDGSIRINTEIRTKQAQAQLAALEATIAKTADKISSLRTKMDSLKEARVPTQEYTEIQAQINSTTQKLNTLLERQERFLETGGRTRSSAYQRMEYDIEQLRNTLRVAEGDMQHLVDTGRAFTLGENTGEYMRLAEQLHHAEARMNALNQRHDLLILRQQQAAAGASRISSSYRRMHRTSKSILSLLGKIAKTVVGRVAKGFKKLGSSIKNMGKSLKGASASSNAIGASFKKILKYGLGIRSLYALVNKLRTGLKEGFTNYYNQVSGFQKSVDNLRASLLTLKNAFASAFAPIAQVAIPYIQALVGWLIKAADAIGQFLAAITGQKTYMKAVKQTTAAVKDQTEATKKAEEAAKGYLSPIDEINQYQSQKQDGGGGAGSGQMFEEVPISEKYKDIAKWLKDMWDDSDFYELGELIGEKLKKALDNIPWDKIKKTARKIGKSIATLINGFVEVEGLGYSIGKTLAEALNTAFEFLNSFVHTLHWDSVGKFIADEIMGFTENIDWDLIKDTFVTGAKGLAKLLNKAISPKLFKEVGRTFAEALNTAIYTTLAFGEEFDFYNLGESISTGLEKLFEKIEFNKLGKLVHVLGDGAKDFADGLFKTNKALAKMVKFNFQALIDFYDNFLEPIGKWTGETAIPALMEAITKFAESVNWDSLNNALGKLFSVLSKFTTGIGEGLIWFWKSVGPFITSLVSAAMNDISAALSFLLDALNSIPKDVLIALGGALGGILSVFITYKSVTGIINSIRVALHLLSIELKLAFAVLTAHPLMAIAVGIGAVVGALLAINEEANEGARQLEIYGEKLSDVSERIDDNKEALEERIKASKDYVDDAGEAEARMASDLADRYFELAEKENLTNSEKSEMQALAKKLVDTIPELEGYYNTETGLLDTTRQSVENLINAKLKQIKLNAIEDKLLEAYKAQDTALDDLVAAQDDVNAALKERETLEKQLKELEDKSKALMEYEDLERKIAASRDTSGELVERQKELRDILTDGGLENIPTFDNLSYEAGMAQRSLEALDKDFDKLMENLVSADEEYALAEGHISDLTQRMTDGMASSAREGVYAYSDAYASTLSADTTMEETTVKKAREIISAWDEGGLPAAMKQNGKDIGEGVKAGISDSFAGLNPWLRQKMFTPFNDGFKSLFGIHSPSTVMREHGKSIVAGLLNGITEKLRNIASWIRNNVFNPFVNAFKNLFGIHSPSTVMRGFGKDIVSGLLGGLKNTWNSVVSWINDKIGWIIDKVNSAIDSLSRLSGVSIGGGFSGGGGGEGRSVAYSARSLMPDFSNIEIPGYATGQVIPRAMRKHLAILGDNNRETEVVSPLSTIEQAVENVAARLGGLGGAEMAGRNVRIEIPIILSGKEITRAVIDEAKFQQILTGKNMFELT